MGPIKFLYNSKFNFTATFLVTNTVDMTSVLCRNLLCATPPSDFHESFRNFAVFFLMVSRYACDLFFFFFFFCCFFFVCFLLFCFFLLLCLRLFAFRTQSFLNSSHTVFHESVRNFASFFLMVSRCASDLGFFYYSVYDCLLFELSHF